MGIEENKAQSLEILTITFWTGAIVSTGFLATKLNLRFWHIILYIVMVYVFVFFWLKGVWKANEKDKIWASVYKSRIDAEINIIPIGSIEEYEEPESCGFYKDWSMRFQAIFTLALLLLCWYTLYILPVVQPCTNYFGLFFRS